MAVTTLITHGKFRAALSILDSTENFPVSFRSSDLQDIFGYQFLDLIFSVI